VKPGETIRSRGARILDPVSGRDGTGDLLIVGGRFAEPSVAPAGARVIDAAGLVAVPGLIDLHVHFREPGNDEAETIASGSLAAARGGFATVVTMPNTAPPVDTPARVRQALERAAAVGAVRLLPSACVSRDRCGRELADLPALAAAGAAAFTDDGATVASVELLEAAMLAARPLGLPILDHALESSPRGGVMHEGVRSGQLGLAGIPAQAEDRIVARNIAACERTGCGIHIQHLSSGSALERIAAARRRGLRVTAEATPHHLALCDTDVPGADRAEFKMSPPLRSAADREALRAGVRDGTIQALATDHAPHRAADKARGFPSAPFGVVGLETAVGVTHTLLVLRDGMPLIEWVRRWTTGPAAILGLPAPALAAGNPANLTLLDLNEEWTVHSAEFMSRSRNTPFEGWKLSGRAVFTFCEGRQTWPPRD
jgi:dihydroorotase